MALSPVFIVFSVFNVFSVFSPMFSLFSTRVDHVVAGTMMAVCTVMKTTECTPANTRDNRKKLPVEI